MDILRINHDPSLVSSDSERLSEQIILLVKVDFHLLIERVVSVSVINHGDTGSIPGTSTILKVRSVAPFILSVWKVE